MQRSGLLIIAMLSGTTLMSSPALSQSNMGGGFIEFLFDAMRVVLRKPPGPQP